MSRTADHESRLNALHESFLGLLLFDVIGALHRRTAADNQSTRRELVRTLFVAIEGLVWTYRQHVLDIARTVDVLTSIEEIALSEKVYSVTARGKIVETTRFIPLSASIRLVAKIAAEIDPKFKADFAEAGWGDFRKAIEIRHRLTHPKSKDDLTLDERDVNISYSGFNWILNLCLEAMDSATEAHKSYLAEFTTIVKKLNEGDPQVWAEYRAAAESIAEGESF